jgi:transcriptional regulator with PAS, ATPase and Fis domain
LTADAAGVLRDYSWPGNIRELRNVTECLVARHDSSDPLTPHDLPPEVRNQKSLVGTPPPAFFV